MNIKNLNRPQNVDFSYLLFDTGPSSELSIMTTFSRKNENWNDQITTTIHRIRIGPSQGASINHVDIDGEVGWVPVGQSNDHFICIRLIQVEGGGREGIIYPQNSVNVVYVYPLVVRSSRFSLINQTIISAATGLFFKITNSYFIYWPQIFRIQYQYNILLYTWSNKSFAGNC